MASKHYSIVIANPATGITREFRVSARLALAVAVAFVALPALVVVGARLRTSLEVAYLEAQNAALSMENESYRAATGQLTGQVAALQAVVNELGDRSKLDPSVAAAIARLPAPVRMRAVGGGSARPQAARTLVSAAASSPENTFGVIRDLLSVLETRLQSVRGDVERWEALGRATPSIWPAFGWLTDRFGGRTDPFTGDHGQHQGLDIAADRGEPVYATADGVVQGASYVNEFGNMVVVSHDFGLTTRYGHLSRFVVTAGQRVSRGDLVGYIGSTGRSTGPHLHYEVWANGAPIDPLKLLTASSPR
jgi:murein DD-endopeptidase MepM/ murein hydrolase activator NlpD